MIIKIIIFLVFILLFHITIPLFSFIGETIKNRMSQGKRRLIRQTKDSKIELSFKQRVKLEKNFGLKEYSKKKEMKKFYIGIMIFPALISLFNVYVGIFFAIIFPYIYYLFNHSKIKQELNDRHIMLERMITFKQRKMGLINSQSNIYDYGSEFQFLEWGEDLKPTKLRIFLPVTFDPLGSTRFIGDFSIAFGRGRPFELDLEDKECPGWNTDKGVATLKLQEALPTKADWDAHYIENEIVQWSFFPLGISSKGGIPIQNPHTGEIERVVGVDLSGDQRKYCEKNGIVVGNDITASPMTLVAGVTGGGKSVGQWNFMNGCLMRPKEWLLFGIDMKKVELSQLRQYGVAVGTTYEDARDVACFVQKVMMDRYEIMEKKGINNWGDMPASERGPAIFLLCDELGECLAPISGKDDASKNNQECQDMIRAALESIARLGRASRVFVLGAAQRPSADILPMQIRQNMSNKLGYGTLPSTISGMLFESNEGARIPGSPKGRAAIKVHSSEVIHFQGFYAPTDWISQYRKSKGLPNTIYGDSALLEELESTKSTNDLGDEMTEDDFLLIENAK